LAPLAKRTDRTDARLFDELRTLIESARVRTAQAVNAELVLLHWQIGKRIREDLLQEERAPYGEQIVVALSRQLAAEFGKGFSRQNLFRMIRFAEIFPDGEIVSSVMRQLSWTHIIYIIALDGPLQRDFYLELCRTENWSTRVLHERIQSMLFERTAISKKPDELIRRELLALRENDEMSADLVFRDPYFLDFLGLSDSYSERDLEQAILRELESFLLELGSDFAFVARQKRITVDNDDYYLDLLFFHRRLKRLIAIDLKIGKFQAADKGQMELYLRWLEENAMQENEEPPIGLILCAGKSDEHIKLLRLDDGRIRVAQYLTELPPAEMLKRKLHDALRRARRQFGHGLEPTAAQPIADRSRPLTRKP